MPAASIRRLVCSTDASSKTPRTIYWSSPRSIESATSALLEAVLGQLVQRPTEPMLVARDTLPSRGYLRASPHLFAWSERLHAGPACLLVYTVWGLDELRPQALWFNTFCWARSATAVHAHLALLRRCTRRALGRRRYRCCFGRALRPTRRCARLDLLEFSNAAVHMSTAAANCRASSPGGPLGWH